MSVIEEIKNSADIVNIVSEYVELVKKGRNYWGVCPFHDDSNPSMSVSPEKQMYNCFSCGEAGGVIKFVEKINKISFKDALKLLGDKVGVEVKINKVESSYNEKQKDVIFALNNAMDYYRLLIDSEKGLMALNYSESRGLNANIREKFSIGYADGDSLVDFLKNKKGVDESTLINASLINSIGNDFFKNRLIFGIKNDFGDIVAMSGRTLSNEDSKYINSAENLVFKKNNILYNFHNAKEHALRAHEIYIVEGFMDVIALYKAGIENVVAIMGTALTENHVHKLSGLTVNLLLDSDKAGINATIKSIKILMENNVKTNVVINDGQKDPDEVFINSGKDGVVQLINNKKTALEFIYELHKKKYDINSMEQMEAFMISFKKYLAMGTEFEKDVFANKMQNELNMSKELILKDITKKFETQQAPATYSQPRREEIKIDASKYNNHAYMLIRSMIRSKKISDYYINNKKFMVNWTDGQLEVIAALINKKHNGEPGLEKYIDFIKEHIKVDGKFVTEENEVDSLVEMINQNTKNFKKDLLKKKISQK